MKNYTITVNGNVYDVTVEENEQDKFLQDRSKCRSGCKER